MKKAKKTKHKTESKNGNGKPLLLKENQRAAAKALLEALEPTADLAKRMTLRNFTSFLRVAVDEGKSAYEYADSANVQSGVMVRHLYDLGYKNRHGNSGLALVEQTKEGRNNKTYITPKGQMLLEGSRQSLKKYAKHA